MTDQTNHKDADNIEAETAAERKARLLKAGIGIGVGSAALVAAFLYANRSRKKKDAKPLDPIDRD